MPNWKNMNFTKDNLIGYLTWDQDITSNLDVKHFTHACHEEDFKQMFKENELLLRSNWDFVLPSGEKMNAKGIWCSLNDFKDNYFGPFVFNFPTSFLNGKKFMVFQVDNYFFFVHHLVRFMGQSKDIKPGEIFDIFIGGDEQEISWAYLLDSESRFHFIFNDPLEFSEDVTITVKNHSKCMSSKSCEGISITQAREILKELVQEELINYPSLEKQCNDLDLNEEESINLLLGSKNFPN